MKKTPVEKVSQISTMKALVLPEDTPIEEAIDRYASNQGQHGIFLTDSNGRLTHVVNNSDILDWARLQFDLVPGSLPWPVGKVRRLLSAKIIAHLAVPNSKTMAVHLDETIDEALKKMAQYDLEDVAVVDDDYRIVNDLRLSEVVSFALHISQNAAKTK